MTVNLVDFLNFKKLSIDKLSQGDDKKFNVRMPEEVETWNDHQFNISTTIMTNVNDTMNYSYQNNSNNEEYIFDRIDVRIIFITLYSIVFFFCFFGNLIVILVVIYSKRMRGVTNFFLANLAVADLCVGIFCVYQTLTNYIMNSWLLGSFFCKLYMFVHALSYTASIMILVLVCIERYLAIVHPIKCRSILTRSRLRIIVMIVWILSAVYASPRFIYVDTIHHELNSGTIDIICIPNIKKNNKNIFDTVNLIILYLLPLLLMTILYTRIAIGLWKSSSAFCTNGINYNKNYHQQQQQHNNNNSKNNNNIIINNNNNNNNHRINHVNSSSKNILRARRGVIKMLVAVVFIFAICNLPQQIRIFWLHWDSNYNLSSNFSTILTVSTFLISYMNSCLNPLLYAFLSRNFRRAMKELFTIDKRNPGRFRMAYINGNRLRFDNENNHTIIPHSSVVRLSSAHDSPVTTQTITRQNTFIKSN